MKHYIVTQRKNEVRYARWMKRLNLYKRSFVLSESSYRICAASDEAAINIAKHCTSLNGSELLFVHMHVCSSPFFTDRGDMIYDHTKSECSGDDHSEGDRY